MTEKSFQHFGVLGCGAWGTALALALRHAGRAVTLWARNPVILNAMHHDHENKAYLPGIPLDASLGFAADLKDLEVCDALIIATPAQHVRATCRQLAAAFSKASLPLLIAAKGIEQKTSALLSDVVCAELPNSPVAIISGPSFAREVAAGLPAALTLAIRDASIGEPLMHAMASPSFRLYLTEDVVGAQIGGAIKNVLAVASGIITGRQLGENARAALLTRGLAEMMRLGSALGGKPQTLMGLSGLGDLVLTCSSAQSRNMSLGIALGQGQKLAAILAARASVTEGVYTAEAALSLAQKVGVEMPIVEAVDAILRLGADIDQTITGLLARPLKAER